MKHLISLLLGIAALTLAAAEENLKAFTLYDPAADGIKGKVWNLSVRNPDDMRAKFAIVDGKDGRKALEISYTGANAKAYSTYVFFNCPKNLLSSEWSLVAIRLTAECDRDLPLRGGIRLPNKKNSNFRAPVPKGLNEIIIRPNRFGYTGRLTIPSVGFWYAKGVTWRIYKIEILAEEFKVRNLPLTFRRRQMIEILPESVPAETLTGVPSDPAAPEDCFAVKLSYSDKELNVSLKSRFSAPPAAESVKHDSAVWLDESQEIFFSPACDNRERYQFTCNALGTVFDSKLGFDQTAAAVVNNVGFTMPHQKKLVFDGKYLTGEYRFPFSALGFRPERDRFMSGLFGQTWKKTASLASVPELLSRQGDGAFIDLKNYALLVFNRKPFGPGSVSITQTGVVRDGRELSITWKAEKVTPGKYKAELRLVRPTFDKIIKTAVVTIPKSGAATGNFNIGGTFPAGNYTAYLLLTNSNGDSIVGGADFSYSPPMKQREDLVVLPTPKKLVWKKGCFNLADGDGIQIASNASAITKRTVRQWAERLAKITGIRRNVGSVPANIEFRIVPGKPQSYTLSVTPKKIVVTGGDEAGLYYGARTVLKLWQGTMKVLPGRPVPCCEISDYPDIAYRPAFINLPKAVSEYSRDLKILEYEPIDYWIDYLDRFVAGNRYNVLMLEPSRVLKFKSHPEMDEAKDNGKRPLIPCGLYSMDELKQLAEFCRDNFIELIPCLPYGRDGWIYRNLKRFNIYHYYHDTENPEYNRLYFDLADELIDTIRKVMPVPFFCVHLDEFMIMKPEIGRKYDPVGRFEKAIARLYAHLKEKKVGMMMYPDTFNPYSARPFDFTKVIETIPRDVVLLHWEMGSGSVRYFSRKGFKVWALGTGLQTFDDDEKKCLSAYGRSLYERGFDWTLYDDGTKPFMSMNALFHAADYGWNLFHPVPGYVDQLTEGTLQKARQTAAVRGSGKAGAAVPVPLDKAFNNDLVKYAARNFPGSKPVLPKTAVSDVANVPMRLSARFVMLKPGSKLNVPVGRKAGSVILLTASHVIPSALPRGYALIGRSIYCGIPAGEFLVKYTDGSVAEIPMRLHKNYDFIDQNPVLRASLDCRYALLLPAGDGKYFTLHQYEWINPHPEKIIQSLGYRQNYPRNPMGLRVKTPIMLFAVTCRECGK